MGQIPIFCTIIPSVSGTHMLTTRSQINSFFRSLSINSCFFDVISSLARGQKDDPAVNAVVCHSPLSNLGYCRKGSTLSISVAFQILRAGLFEVKSVCFNGQALPLTKNVGCFKKTTGCTHLNTIQSILCL